MKISEIIEVLEMTKKTHGDKKIKILADMDTKKTDLDLIVKIDGLWLQ